MIYTVISRTDELSKYFEYRDCSSEQPLNLHINEKFLSDNNISLTDDIIKYISETKNKSVREERFSAYISLFYSLEHLFSINPKRILREKNGKPFIEDNIYFSISHCEGLTAVTLSKDRDVGVDIQKLISAEFGKKIDSRFMSEFEVENEDLDIVFFYLSIDDEEKVELSSLCSNMKHFILNAKELCDESLNKIYSSYQENKKREFYFTEKWAAMESIIKLSGGGFYDIKRIKEILPKTVSKQNAVFCDGKIYILSNSIYK